MASAIDATKPVQDSAALTSDLRANLAAAKSEIEALQDGKIPLPASPSADDFLVYAGTTWTAVGGAAVRTAIGLVIGTDVQAYDATLSSLAALGTAADKIAYLTGVDTWAETPLTAAGRSLIDDASASAQRTTLGLGTAAVLNTGVTDGDVIKVATGDKLPAIDGSNLTNIATGIRNHIADLTLSNDTDTANDINITAGEAADSTNASLLTLSAETTKRIDATWAAGDDAGGLFTGSVAADTTYHVFIIKKDSDGSIDAGFDTSLSAANIPSGYTKYRRIGSIVTNSSSNIINFTQKGNRFIYDVQIQDVAVNPAVNTAVSYALSVPTGLKVNALLYFICRATNNGALDTFSLITSLDQTDSVPAVGIHSQYFTNGTGDVFMNSSTYLAIRTNTSGQVRTRVSSTIFDVLRIHTVGWIDFFED